MAELDRININGSLYNFKDASAYHKPNDGIPSSDLTSAIQALLTKASTALQPQDLTTLNSDVASLKALIESDSDNVINKFNEIVTFLNGISASSSLDGIISDISSQINAKYSKPIGGIPMNDLSNEVQQAINSGGGSSPTITMDDTPTSGSNNAVKSSGIKTALDLKANQSTTYTKTEVDSLLEDVAILADDDGQATTLTFDPQADTVWNKAQTLGSAQQAQARNNIGAVGSVTVNGTTYTPVNGNVDLGTISGGGSGDVNVIETVKVNGTALVPDANKAVDVTVPSAVTESTVSGWGFTKNTGNVSSTDVTTIVYTTQAAYDALATKDSNTLYIIPES